MATADKNLTLGVVFKGEIGKSLEASVKRLETLVNGLNTALGGVKKAGGVQALADLGKQAEKAATAFKTMGQSLSNDVNVPLSDYAKAMVKAEGNGKRFTTTLSELSKFYKGNKMEIQDTEKAMYKADGVLRQLNREVANGAIQTSLAKNNWKYARDEYVSFKNAANLTTITQKVLNGEIKNSRAGITEYIKQLTGGRVAFGEVTVSSKKLWPEINKVNQAIDDGTQSWQSAARRQAEFQVEANKSVREIAEFTKASGKAVPNMNALNKEIDAGTRSWQSVAREQSAYQSALNGTLPVQQRAAAILEANAKSIKNVNAAYAEASKENQVLSDRVAKLSAKYPELGNQVEKAMRSVASGNTTYAQATVALEANAKSIKNVNTAYAEASKENQVLSDRVAKLSARYPELGNQVEKAMRSVASGNTTYAQATVALEANAKSIKNVNTAYAEASKENQVLSDRVAKLSARYPELGNQVEKAMRSVASGNTTYAQATVALEANAKSIKNFETESKKLDSTIARLYKQTTQLTNQYPTLGEKVQSVMGHVAKGTITWEEAQGVMKRAGERSKALAKELSAAETASKNLAKQTSELHTKFPAFGAEVQKVMGHVAKGTISYKEAVDVMGRMSTRTKELSDFQAGLGKTLTALQSRLGLSTAEMHKFASSTKTAEAPITFLGKQIGSVSGAVDRLKAAFKVTAAYGAASAAIYAVTTAFRTGMQAIVEYDQALKNLQAISGATDAEVSVMGDTIKDVARTTKFSATEVADGMVLLTQAGFSAGEALDAIQATANLAAGTLADMGVTTDLLTTTIRAFNLDTIESARVSDVMANAINKSKLTIDKLRTAFNYIAATASQAGLTLEETAASMMVLANNGLRASTIGTGLRQVLSRLLSPNEKLREAYEATGIAVEQINPKTVGYQTALENLAKVLYDANTRTVNVAKAFELFGLRGAQAAAILVRDFISGSFQEALHNVFQVGSAADMAAKQSEGLGFKLKNLADRAKNVAIGFGDAGIAGAIGMFTDAVAKGLGWLEKFANSGIGAIIVQTGLMVGAITALTAALAFLKSAFVGLSIIQTFTTGMAAATSALVYFGAATTGVAGAMTKLRAAATVLWTALSPHPFALITTAVAAVVTAILHFGRANERLADQLSKQAVEYDRVSKGVGLYAETIGLAEKGSDEYNSALERFEETFPEVTKEILKMTGALDLADLSLEEVVESMNRIEQTSAQQAFESAKKNAELLAEELRKVSNSSDDLWGPQFIKNGEDAAETSELVKEKTEKLNQANYALTQSIKRMVEVESISIDQAYEMIDALLGEGEAADKVKGQFERHFNAIALGANDAAGGYKEAFADVPAYFRDLYSQLDANQQTYLMKAVQSMQAEVAAYRKRASDMNISELDRQNHVDAIQQAAYQKFLESIGKYALDTKSVTESMTASWKAYYDQLSLEDKFAVEQTYANLETRAKALKKFLETRVTEHEITEQQLNEKMQQWWEKELQGYKETQEKKIAEHQKFADKIKSLEEKLEEDKKIIRQAGMTEDQINKDNLLAASQALADAQKAVAEATTMAEAEEAMKKLEIARKMYSEILAASQQVAKAQESSRQSVAEKSKQADVESVESHKAALEQKTQATQKYTADEIANINKYGTAYKEQLDAQKAEEDAYADYLTQMRDNLVQEDIARIKKQYGENSVELQNYMKTVEGFHDSDKAKAIETDQAKAASSNQAYNSMKSAAENAFGAIEQMLNDLRTKFETPAVLKTDTSETTTKLTEVNKVVDDLQSNVETKATLNLEVEKPKEDLKDAKESSESLTESVKEPKTLQIDGAEKAATDLGTVAEKSKEVAETINEPKKVVVETQTADDSLNTLQTTADHLKKVIEEDKIYGVDTTSTENQLKAVETLIKDSTTAIQAEKVYMVETQTADDSLNTLQTTADHLKKVIEEDKKYGVDTTSTEKQLEAVETLINDSKTAIESEKVYKVETQTADNSLNTLQTTADHLKKVIEEDKIYGVDTTSTEKQLEAVETLINDLTDTINDKRELKVDFTGSGSATLPITEKVTAVKKLLESITNTTWATTVNITVAGIALLEEAKKLITWLNNRITKSTHTITVKGLDALRSALHYHNSLDGKETTSTHTIKVKGQGSTVKPISEKIKEISGLMSDFTDKVSEGANYVIDFKGKGSATLPLSSKIDALKIQLNEFKEAIEMEGGTFVVDFGGYDGDSQEGLSYAIKKARQKLADLQKENFNKNVNVNFTGSDGGLHSSASDVIKEVQRKISELENNIELGLSTADAQRKLHDLKIQLATFEEAKELGITYKGNPLATGGPIGFDSGGQLGGYGGGDKVPAMLEPGEYVIRKEAVKKYGAGLFEKLNGMIQKFATGGLAVKSYYSTDRSSNVARNPIDIAKDWLALYKHDPALINPLVDVAKRRNNFDLLTYLDKLKSDTFEALRYVTDLLYGKAYKSRIERELYEREHGIFSTGGKLSGYGGGDKVPAMLEAGEFVIRKEAVKKYGAGLFEKLNGMAAKMRLGGPVHQTPKFATGGAVASQGKSFGLSDQVHTINLNINNAKHTLYGDAQAVQGLIKTLRREQLVTA